MDMGWWWLAILLGTVLLAHAFFVVRRLPEPADAGTKPPYATLFGPGAICGLSLASVLLQATALGAPVHVRLALIVWLSSVFVLVAVDQQTTWLPLILTRWCAAELAVAILIGAALDPSRAGWTIGGAIAGGVGAYAFFWIMWRVSNALGFGDVRLAGMLGALSGAWSFDAWWASLLAATVIGAVLGVVTAIIRRHRAQPPGPFAYGPGLWSGPLAVLAVTILTH